MKRTLGIKKSSLGYVVKRKTKTSKSRARNLRQDSKKSKTRGRKGGLLYN